MNRPNKIINRYLILIFVTSLSSVKAIGSYEYKQELDLGYEVRYIGYQSTIQDPNDPQNKLSYFSTFDDSRLYKISISHNNGAITNSLATFYPFGLADPDFHKSIKKIQWIKTRNNQKLYYIVLDNGFFVILDENFSVISTKKLKNYAIDFLPDGISKIEFVQSEIDRKMILQFKHGTLGQFLEIYDMDLNGFLDNPIRVSVNTIEEYEGLFIRPNHHIHSNNAIIMYENQNILFCKSSSDYKNLVKISEFQLINFITDILNYEETGQIIMIFILPGDQISLKFYDINQVISSESNFLSEIIDSGSYSILEDYPYPLIMDQSKLRIIELHRNRLDVLYTLNFNSQISERLSSTPDKDLIITPSGDSVVVYGKICDVGCSKCSGILSNECIDCSPGLKMIDGKCQCEEPTTKFNSSTSLCECKEPNFMEKEPNSQKCRCKDYNTMILVEDSCSCQLGFIKTSQSCDSPPNDSPTELNWAASKEQTARIKSIFQINAANNDFINTKSQKGSSIRDKGMKRFEFFIDFLDIQNSFDQKIIQANNIESLMIINLKNKNKKMKILESWNYGYFIKVIIQNSDSDIKSQEDVEVSFLRKELIGTINKILMKQEIQIVKIDNLDDDFILDTDSDFAKISKSIAYFSLITLLLSMVFLCSNFAQRIIKLFQIIEFFGIFYYIPVQFGDILDDYLAWLIELGDLVDIPSNLIMKPGELGKMKSYNKLTRDSVPKELLSSFTLIPIVILVVTGIYCVLYLVQVVSRRKLSFLNSIRKFEYSLFDFSVIELSFYIVYSLLSTYHSLIDYSFAEIMSKICAILLSLRIIYIYSDILSSLFQPLPNTEGFYFKQFKDTSSIDTFKSSKLIRIIEPLFVLRLIVCSIIIICLQYLPLACILSILAVHSLYLAIFISNISRYKLHSGLLMTFNKILIEISLSVFILSILFRSYTPIDDNSFSTLLEILVILFSIFCILSEILMTIVALVSDFVGLIASLKSKKKNKVQDDIKISSIAELGQQQKKRKKRKRKNTKFSISGLNDEENKNNLNSIQKNEVNKDEPSQATTPSEMTPIQGIRKKKNHFTVINGKRPSKRSKFRSNTQSILINNVSISPPLLFSL